MYTIIRRASSRRLALFGLIALFVIWHYSFPSPSSTPHSPDSEWIQLQQRMNQAQHTSPDEFFKSSFDWGSVKRRYRIHDQRPLPSRRATKVPPVQSRFGPESPSAAQLRRSRLAEVRQLFVHNWNSYRRFAWMKDALLPISGGFVDQFSGWSATLVDSLDTLWIMGLRDEFDEAVAAAAQIDFGRSTSPRVNMFETNIRYLGGLLSAYDLSGRESLLQKAVELGDLLYAGFDTQNGMPVDFIQMASARSGKGLIVEDAVVSVSPGTLSLELTHLSQLTGDSKYYSAVDPVMDLFYRGQSKTSLPGVWPMHVSMRKLDVVHGQSFTIGGGEDSLYEYLPKMYQLLRGADRKYALMAKASLDAIQRHFLFCPMVPDQQDILMPGNVNILSDSEPVLDPETEHLACFAGAMYGLAGRLFRRPADIDTGLKLTNGCVFAYRSFPTGMMPERINMVPCPSRSSCSWDEEVWANECQKRPEFRPHLPLGFTTAKDPRYILRPEAIESVFYMYRITGRPEYQEMAWDMFVAVSNGTRTSFANAAVSDVTKAKYPLPKEDYMESFWLAETLKYFYLIFSSPDVISLDEFVLNTEAHPFKIPT